MIGNEFENFYHHILLKKPCLENKRFKFDLNLFVFYWFSLADLALNPEQTTMTIEIITAAIPICQIGKFN